MRNRWTFWPAALALVVISLIPFFLVDVPAVLDYPNHLARMFVLAHPDDPILSRFYAPHWRVLPNLGFDALGVLMLKVLPVHIGGRILLATSLVAPMLGVFAYSRAAFGKLGVWQLAAVLTAFNGIFFLGFMNFLLATGLAFAAAGLWLMLRRQGRDGLCLLFRALASALLFLCHIFGVFLFALLIACQEIARGHKAESTNQAPITPRGLLLIVIALLPAILLYFASPLSDQTADVYGWDGSHKIWTLFTPFMTYSKVLTLVTGLAVFSALILNWRSATFAPGTKLTLILLAVICVAAPVGLKGGTMIDIRLALMMGLLLFGGVQLNLSAPQEKAMVLAVAALVVLRSVSTGAGWLDHRNDLADLRAAIASIEPGARVLAARDKNPQSDAVTPSRNLPDVQPLDRDLPALLVIERRAFWPGLFADAAQQPLTVRPPYDGIAQALGDPLHQPLGDPLQWSWWTAADPARGAQVPPYQGHWRQDFDYVLLIDRPPSLRPPQNFIPIYVGHYAALWRLAH